MKNKKKCYKNNHGDNSIIPSSTGKRIILFACALLSTDNTCACYFPLAIHVKLVIANKNTIFSVRSRLFL